MFLIFRHVHKNFVEKLKIVIKNSEELHCSYGKVSHDLNREKFQTNFEKFCKVFEGI